MLTKVTHIEDSDDNLDEEEFCYCKSNLGFVDLSVSSYVSEDEHEPEPPKQEPILGKRRKPEGSKRVARPSNFKKKVVK